MSISHDPSKQEVHCFESTSFRSRHWLHTLKMSLLSSLLFFIIIGTLLAVNVHSAPSTTLHTQRAEARFTMDNLQSEEVAILPRPPSVSEHNIDRPTSKTLLKELNFIKSSKCKLNRSDESGIGKPNICGYRQVDLPQGRSGVLLWRPADCQPYHCRCVPTKEVRRLRRTMANKTVLDYHRFRVFECV